ncbi:unnamed protein product, partial [Prorocentrum cordatum]
APTPIELMTPSSRACSRGPLRVAAPGGREVDWAARDAVKPRGDPGLKPGRVETELQERLANLGAPGAAGGRSSMTFGVAASLGACSAATLRRVGLGSSARGNFEVANFAGGAPGFGYQPLLPEAPRPR